MKLFVTEFADSKKEIERELKSRTEQVILHLFKLYLMSDNESRNHWIREIANFLNSVSLLSGKNKFPTSKQIYEWTYDKYQDVITNTTYIRKMTYDIIDDYGVDISKSYSQICDEFDRICENYFKWLSNELSQSGFVSRREIFDKLNELI